MGVSAYAESRERSLQPSGSGMLIRAVLLQSQRSLPLEYISPFSPLICMANGR